jgi:UDP-glucuronate 4-epimerase
MKRVLITGVAGFIGFHITARLLQEGFEVTGIDNLNNYYDPVIKSDRLAMLGIGEHGGTGMAVSALFSGFRFQRMHLEEREALATLFRDGRFDTVIHLAAQAGVRYSIENPYAYIDSNITGFMNLIECCRHYPPKHLVYASSSSVYGLSNAMPLSVHQSIAHPISMYAATKKCNELIAHTYSHLFGLPTTGLRFFTVYGPWGRPDMALFLFTRAILAGKPINVFNQGEMLRDFTYIDDIVEGIRLVMEKPPVPNPEWSGVDCDPASSSAPYRIYNIGNSNPVMLMDFIEAIETQLGKKALLNMLPMQPGDVPRTFSDVSDLSRDTGYLPRTNVKEGIARFLQWYLNYYRQQIT